MKGALMGTQSFEYDLIPTSMGKLGIHFLGHGSLMLDLEGKIIHVDPFSRVANYAELPRADIIIITHEHPDHLDPEALKQIRTEKTILILTALCAQQVQGGTVLKIGENTSLNGILVEAVPAYNIVHTRENG
ncbi:MAG: MBL fold metallo-hydrolase, partial [Lentisphaerota bacterium]